MTISTNDEADAAIGEISALLRQWPPLDSPEARRMIWLTKEVKDWLLSDTDPALAAHQARARQIWSDIDKMLAGWGG